MENISFENKKQNKLFKKFIEKFPQYLDTQIIDELRATEYERLDRLGHIYLDYTGGNLYAQSQLDRHHDLLKNNVFGNPHSSNPTSLLATELVKEAREFVLDCFHAKEDYYCIFTANASGALKIIGECYPFNKNTHLTLTFDNHNSVNGIREFAQKKGSSFCYSTLFIENLRLNEKKLKKKLNTIKNKEHKLFAFPAQSNVSGVKHPLSWVRYAQKRGWDVLLDAAAFVPSSPLNLKEVQPNFVAMSFYKIFGYPTGLGALLVRKDSFHKLQKPWFAGGTVSFVSVHETLHSLEKNCARFEDGTINYLDIPAIKIGLEHIHKIGMNTINTRVHCLTGWLLQQLKKLKHNNGTSMITLLGPQSLKNRGGTIIFNICDEEGKTFPWDYVEHLANEEKISLRTGCFCNPGIDEISNCISTNETAKYYDNLKEGGYAEVIKTMGKLRGAIRISVGLASNFNDVNSFINFVKTFKNKSASDIEFGNYLSDH